MKLRLPASLDSQQTSVFSLLCPLNRLMVAADEPTERTIIECLIRELNLKFNVGLDTNFSISRTGLSRSDLTTGRWDQEATTRSAAGRSGKRNHSGPGSGPSKCHF